MRGKMQYVSAMFYRKKEIERAVREAKLDAHFGNNGGQLVNDPTGNNGARLADGVKEVTLYDGTLIKYPEKWIVVMNLTYENMDAFTAKIMKEKYESGMKWNEICDEENIVMNSYYRMLHNGLCFAVALACQFQILRLL